MQGQGQEEDGNGEAVAWRSDYSVPGSSPLTGMGQRSVSASNLAALGNMPIDFLSTQAHCESLSQPPFTVAVL